MSGHSHFATIKRQKEANDAKRGNLFSKLARSIMIAAKGNPNPDTNFRLRVEMEKAKSMGLPKENIQRAIGKAAGEGASIEEITYEGFGPGGIYVLVETATDNKNRTAQEIKNIFEKAGGRVGGPGSVSYNFDSKGYLLVKKTDNADEQMLKIIDFGVEDIEESDDGLEIYVEPSELSGVKEKIESAGYEVLETQLRQKPKTFTQIEDKAVLDKALKFLETLDSHDDVNNVFTNL